MIFSLDIGMVIALVDARVFIGMDCHPAGPEFAYFRLIPDFSGSKSLKGKCQMQLIDGPEAVAIWFA